MVSYITNEDGKLMKILVVADIESSYIWDFFDKSNFKDIDCVISCGDLKPTYLSFLVTMLAVPVYYVPGNHDKCYDSRPPEGCDSIDNKVITFKGVRIGGLGGSICYNGDKYQYTEAEMQKRVKKFIRTSKKPIDILVTHSPTAGLGDDPDSMAHRGFTCFHDLYAKLQPKYHLYGHNHLTYSSSAKRHINHDNIELINGYNYYILEF